MSKYNYESGEQDYQTPPELLEVIFQEMNLNGIWDGDKFGCDVCCSEKNIPANFYYINGEIDGLTADWCMLNYCNPPFKECGKWVKKAYEEKQKGNSTVMLIPARTETKYWQEYILNNGCVDNNKSYVKFLRKEWAFIDPKTKNKMGIFKNPLAIVMFKREYCYNDKNTD